MKLARRKFEGKLSDAILARLPLLSMRPLKGGGISGGPFGGATTPQNPRGTAASATCVVDRGYLRSAKKTLGRLKKRAGKYRLGTPPAGPPQTPPRPATWKFLAATIAVAAVNMSLKPYRVLCSLLSSQPLAHFKSTPFLHSSYTAASPPPSCAQIWTPETAKEEMSMTSVRVSGRGLGRIRGWPDGCHPPTWPSAVRTDVVDTTQAQLRSTYVLG